MRNISEALDQYTGICKEALHDCASKLSKSFESVIIVLYMVIPGKINFTQMGRYGRHCEQCYRQNYGRLRLQCLFCLAQPSKGHDEGTGNGIFHVQVQTADDQHVRGQANF